MLLSLRRLFKGLYKLCECNNKDCFIPIINTQGEFARFKHGHHAYNKKGETSSNWKGGRYKNNDYWLLRIPDYFSSYSDGYVLEHVYNYQEYHKCCMLSWGVVHHIIPIKDGGSNLPWNLQGMMQYKHISIHHKKDTSDRRCSNPKCKSPTITYIRKSGWANWHRDDKGNWLCHNCYGRIIKRRVINLNSPWF